MAEAQQRAEELATRQAEPYRQCGERQSELDRLQAESETTQAAEEAESWRARIEVDVEELVQLARRTQMLLFTHHQHLVNLAQESLPGAASHCITWTGHPRPGRATGTIV